jgi:hypothetical protein
VIATRWLGCQRIELAECGSTNDEAGRLARAGAKHGTVVLAQAQKAGRGRDGRVWESAVGGLYLSAVLRPPLPLVDVPPMTLAIGIGVCDAARTAGAAAVLKWPNDVLVGGRKLSGVLVEAQSQGGKLDAVIADLHAADLVLVGRLLRGQPRLAIVRRQARRRRDGRAMVGGGAATRGRAARRARAGRARRLVRALVRARHEVHDDDDGHHGDRYERALHGFVLARRAHDLDVSRPHAVELAVVIAQQQRAIEIEPGDGTDERRTVDRRARR